MIDTVSAIIFCYSFFKVQQKISKLDKVEDHTLFRPVVILFIIGHNGWYNAGLL